MASQKAGHQAGRDGMAVQSWRDASGIIHLEIPIVNRPVPVSYESRDVLIRQSR